MNYESVYHNLCLRGINRKKSLEEIYEKHHITPRCLGGSDDKSNITILTVREHYIAHWLLCKIHKHSDLQIRKKLANAFLIMCYHNTDNRKFNSKQYERAKKERKNISFPMSSEVRQKISESHKRRSEILNKIKMGKMPLCLCGCGLKVTNKKNQYLNNHWNRSETSQKGYTAKVREHLSSQSKNYISSLSLEEKQHRLQKSLHSNKVNHVKRGQKISESKKGKKTNQSEISGKRYANMTDTEFAIYLKNIHPHKHKSLTNMRNKWKK